MICKIDESTPVKLNCAVALRNGASLSHHVKLGRNLKTLRILSPRRTAEAQHRLVTVENLQWLESPHHLLWLLAQTWRDDLSTPQQRSRSRASGMLISPNNWLPAHRETTPSSPTGTQRATLSPKPVLPLRPLSNPLRLPRWPRASCSTLPPPWRPITQHTRSHPSRACPVQAQLPLPPWHNGLHVRCLSIWASIRLCIPRNGTACPSNRSVHPQVSHTLPHWRLLLILLDTLFLPAQAFSRQSLLPTRCLITMATMRSSGSGPCPFNMIMLHTMADLSTRGNTSTTMVSPLMEWYPSLRPRLVHTQWCVRLWSHTWVKDQPVAQKQTYLPRGLLVNGLFDVVLLWYLYFPRIRSSACFIFTFPLHYSVPFPLILYENGQSICIL